MQWAAARAAEQEASAAGGSGSEAAGPETEGSGVPNQEVGSTSGGGSTKNEDSSEVAGGGGDSSEQGVGVGGETGSEVVSQETYAKGSAVATEAGRSESGIDQDGGGSAVQEVGVAGESGSVVTQEVSVEEKSVPGMSGLPPVPPDSEEPPQVQPPLPSSEPLPEPDGLQGQQPPLPAADEMLRDPREVARDLHLQPPSASPSVEAQAIQSEDTVMAEGSGEHVPQQSPVGATDAGQSLAEATGEHISRESPNQAAVAEPIPSPQPVMEEEIEECDMEVDSPSWSRRGCSGDRQQDHPRTSNRGNTCSPTHYF